MIKRVKSIFVSNEKVVENYFFMTALQVLSSAFGILIYPYLIRVLGSESYGIYVFAVAIVSYFTSFISFGFNLPNLKVISQNKDNQSVKSEAISAVLTLKMYFGLLSLLIFVPLLLFIPLLNNHKLIFIISIVQILAEIIYPVWYFQGVQKMKIVTYSQLLFRIISLPFIFIFIKSGNDIELYTLIATLSIILPAISLLAYIVKVEKVTIRLLPFNYLKSYLKDATPFFWSTAAGTLKQESVTILLGSFFSMRDVALYDLANKLIMLPRMLTSSLNSALFPKVIEKNNVSIIKKIIRYEWFIGLAAIGFIALFGYWIILVLGGESMLEAYPLSIILGITVLVWLVVGSYINFIFLPKNKYYFVTKNQIIALLSFILFAGVGMLFFKSMLAIVIALSLSGICEIIYCKYLILKHKLL